MGTNKMNIPKSRKGLIVAVGIGVLTGVVGDAIWDGIKQLAPIHGAGLHAPHVALGEVFQLAYFVAIGLVGVFLGVSLGRRLEAANIAPRGSPDLKGPSLSPPRAEIHQSQTFVLEVEGTRPLDSENSDWRFFLTNCTTRILRRVELYNFESEIGAYVIGFHEVPVMQPGQKVLLNHEILPQREVERYSDKKATLWDFAMDHKGIRGHSYIWYDIYIEYRDQDDNSVRDGGFVGVCFDLSNKKLKTEGAEYYRKNNFRAMLGEKP